MRLMLVCKIVQPNILTWLFSPPISETADGAVDSSPTSVKDGSGEYLHLQAPMALQVLNRADVIAIVQEVRAERRP
jgi:hypothetical protein